MLLSKVKVRKWGSASVTGALGVYGNTGDMIILMATGCDPTTSRTWAQIHNFMVDPWPPSGVGWSSI